MNPWMRAINRLRFSMPTVYESSSEAGWRAAIEQLNTLLADELTKVPVPTWPVDEQRLTEALEDLGKEGLTKLIWTTDPDTLAHEIAVRVLGRREWIDAEHIFASEKQS